MGKGGEAIKRIASWLNIVGMVFVITMMLTTTTDVFLRYVFNSPILGAFEVSQYLLAGVIWFGMGWIGVVKGHVSAEILYDRFSRRWQAILTVVAHSLELVFFALITWQTTLMILYSIKHSLRTDILHIPAAIGQLSLPIGACLASIVAAYYLYQAIQQVKNPTAPSVPKGQPEAEGEVM